MSAVLYIIKYYLCSWIRYYFSYVFNLKHFHYLTVRIITSVELLQFVQKISYSYPYNSRLSALTTPMYFL